MKWASKKFTQIFLDFLLIDDVVVFDGMVNYCSPS